MKRVFVMICVALALVAMATTPTSVTAGEGEEGGPKPYLNLSGFYAFNGYSQNNFFLGKGVVGGVSDKDEYAIQMFRLMAEFGFGDDLKAVIRTDMGQGIWGIDNSQRDNDRSGFSNLFNNKDSNFEIHVDWAYVDYTNPDWGLNLKLGRQKFKLGNLLVLDQDNDGILLTKNLGPGKLTFGWAKMSEGANSLSDADVSGTGGMDAQDSDLYLLSWASKGGSWSINPYVAYYKDQGYSDGTAYIPQGYQYFKARFTPQITSAHVAGLAFKGKAGIWEFKGEADYLEGEDDIPNVDSGPKEMLDVNNGELSGFNLYFDARAKLGPGKLGLMFGLGSGDHDPMSGDGNINNIRTNGFFYLTEVWEDSVMPDELGITPQGLGSPASRGYREFENSTVFQINYTWNICSEFTYFVSGTWVRATEDVFPWSDVNSDGAIQPDEMGTVGDDDLGRELDMRLAWKLTPGLTWVFRGGVFWPGDAAAYLINGTNLFTEEAYELRTTLKYSFGGLKLGG